LPLRELVAGVERETGERRRGCPEQKRLLHALSDGRTLHGTGVTLEIATVGTPVRDHRPAVVFASLDDIQLVATLRAVLCLPEFARLRMKREPHRVADPHGVDLRPVSGLVHERVVLRRSPIVVQPEDFSVDAGWILRIHWRRNTVPGPRRNRNAE